MEPSTGQPRPHQSTFHLLATKTICLTFYKCGDISYQLDGLKIEALEIVRSVCGRSEEELFPEELLTP